MNIQNTIFSSRLFRVNTQDNDDIWRNMESTIRLFAEDCVIYRKIINNADMEILQKEFRNNLTQRLNLGESSQLHGEKGLESTTFHNVNTKKG